MSEGVSVWVRDGNLHLECFVTPIPISTITRISFFQPSLLGILFALTTPQTRGEVNIWGRNNYRLKLSAGQDAESLAHHIHNVAAAAGEKLPPVTGS